MASVPSSYPPKKSEHNIWFFTAFRGYEMETLGGNSLIIIGGSFFRSYFKTNIVFIMKLIFN